jgi:chitin synthase
VLVEEELRISLLEFKSIFRYRVFTDDIKCLIASDGVYQDYSRNDVPSLHEKNLFELGEDRMLTTLLLQHFPGMRLSFVPEAICWTIVPHTFAILLSQRRRWINSTFHNMYELLKVENMCGICFLSMKTVVIMDMIVTMILPASLVYIGYLTYLFISQPETLDTFVLMFYGATFVMQMLSFLIRSRWDYIWWFAIFTVVGIPVFYFILPIYAFTHMDDFSWGKTRQIGTSTQMKLEAAIQDSDEDSTKLDDEFDQTSTNKSIKSSERSNGTGPANKDEEIEIHVEGMDDVWNQSGSEEARILAPKRRFLTANHELEEKHSTIVMKCGIPYASSRELRGQPAMFRDEHSVESHRSGRYARSQRSHRSAKSHQSSKAKGANVGK